MTWYVAVSLSALVVMSYLLVKVRWQMRKLEEQLRFVQDKQSDGILVSDIRILGIGKLTDSLNEILQKQRSNRQEWVQKEKRLVQTYTNLSHDIRTPLTSLDGYFSCWRIQRMQRSEHVICKLFKNAFMRCGIC